MTKTSLKAFNTYLSNSNSPEWGTECVVGVITLSHALEDHHHNHFSYLTMHNLSIMTFGMANQNYMVGEWRVSDFMRSFNDYAQEELKNKIDKTLQQFHLPRMISSFPVTQKLMIYEISEEIAALAPNVEELDRSYFLKVSWDAAEPDDKFIFIIPARELVNEAMQGVERALDYYLID